MANAASFPQGRDLVFRLKPAQRALAASLFALCGLLAGLVAAPATAADPLTIPPGPLPVGELPPVELSYVTIDATVSANDDGAAIEVRTRAGLRNPNKRSSFERQVSFPGPAVSGVRVGTQNWGLAPAAPTGPWTLSLPRDGDAVIEGRQYLAASGPLTELQFDWEALAPWGQRLSAVRLTFHFAEGIDSGQLLLAHPAPTDRSTRQLTWSYEGFQPAGTVRLLLIAPSCWQAVRTARQAAAGTEAGAAEYLALAEALGPLLATEGLPARVASTLQAEQLAALEQAVVAAPDDPTPHRELAAHLRARAAGDPALLERAVAELKAAHDLAPGDAELSQQLAAAVEELIAACRQLGDSQGILRALDMAQAIDARNSPQRAAAYADLAVSLLSAGRQAEAEATIVAGFGQAALDHHALHRPHFHSVTGEVETKSGERAMRFSLVPAPGMEAAAEADVAHLAQALSQMGARVEQPEADGALRLEATIPFADAEALRSAAQAAVASLPSDADPAVQLVAAVVAPARFACEASQGLRADLLTYVEASNLTPAQEALQRRLEQLRWARSEAELPTEDPVEAARRRWTLALLDRYEAGWQALVRGSRVSYRLLPPEDIVAPRWDLAWGESRELTWRMQVPRPKRLWPLGAGLLLAGGLALAAAYRRRR